jgi:polyisoprenyl-teichoic acid--peptidoglycan teichoic acid transferase
MFVGGADDGKRRGRALLVSKGACIVPAMHEPEGARPRARSPFAAAFLSLIFPGLGQLYAGAPARALAFAATPILFIALIAGVGLRLSRVELIGLVLNPLVLSSAFVINLIILAYRLVAIIDAYRVAEYMNTHAAGIAAAVGNGTGPARRRGRNPLSIAGLVAVILVMAGSHVVVARYDMLALSVLDSGCIFIGDTGNSDCAADATASPDTSGGATTTPGQSAAPTDTPVPVTTPQGSALPQVSIPPWNGTDRLNILLIGSDQRAGDVTHNTDTLIVVSIDPGTKNVVMFSLPRDTVDVPLPPGPARSYFGSVYSQKINAFWSSVRKRNDLFPGDPKKNLPGYNGLKAILGNLYGLDIKYFVEVNFDGFQKVVNAMGGVTINVQMPVSDDRFPYKDGYRRVYIPSGIQHMTGYEALVYARSRHGSNDFDRGVRQQRVLLSLREQADPQALIPRLPDLVTALQQTVKTDIPVNQLAPLLGLASEVDTKNIRSYVFAPPFYDKEFLNSPRGYIIEPNIPRIRAAVQEAFTANPSDEAERQKLATEGADLWVLNGTGDTSIGPKLSGFLEWQGINASAPRQRPPGAVPATTTIVAYNGALADNPDTVAYLQQTFGTTVVEKDDPAIRADFILTVGKNTPALEAPLAP